MSGKMVNITFLQFVVFNCVFMGAWDASVLWVLRDHTLLQLIVDFHGLCAQEKQTADGISSFANFFIVATGQLMLRRVFCLR
jgi:hypothetical protein